MLGTRAVANIDLRMSRGRARGEAARWGVRVGWRFRAGEAGKGAAGGAGAGGAVGWERRGGAARWSWGGGGGGWAEEGCVCGRGNAPLAPQALETGDFGIVEPIL